MSELNLMKQALTRADLWRALALALGPPTAETPADLQGLCRDLASALPPEETAYREGLEELARHAEGADPAALEHEHNLLFSMQVLVPAYEGGYQRTERGAVIGDVAGFYTAFGLQTAERSGPPDSLWNELAFMSWLSLKEAYAAGNGLDEALAVTRNAARDFLQDHLGRWVGAFAALLLRTTAHPLYSTAAHLLLAVVSRAAGELDVGEIAPLDFRSAFDETAEPVCCPAVARLV